MALRLRLVAPKCLAPAMQNHHLHSRAFIPAIFTEDPLKLHRKIISDFCNITEPSEPFVFAPSQRFVKYRTPAGLHQEEKHVCNLKDGFQVSLNVAHFKPDEINVKVVDNCVFVEAKHEERSEDGESYVSRQFSRRYYLPDEYSIADVVSKLSSDGILTVVAPPKELNTDKGRNIQIQQTGSPAEEKPTNAKIDDKVEGSPAAA